MATDFEWTLMENPIVPARFPEEDKKKLLAWVMTHIHKSLSQSITHHLYFEATDNRKSLLDQINEIRAQDYTWSSTRNHVKRHVVFVCNNDNCGLDQYINGHQKIRCKMIQCKVPNVTVGNERETVRLILMGLVDHPTYGTLATNMFSTDFPTTIAGVKVRLESHAIMINDHPSDSRHRGMPAPSKTANERLPDDMYQAMTRLLDRKLANYQKRDNHGWHRTRGNDRDAPGGCGTNKRRNYRARRGKSQGREQDD